MLLFLLVAAVMAVSAFYIFTHKSLPKTGGQIVLSGLERPVVIIRDEWGVPHITAETEADLFFASGFVQAQDRLFQMDLSRRFCEGRLSEWVGPDGLEPDRLARVIGFHRQAKRNLERIPAGSREVLEAYAAGVNAFLDWRKTNLPMEYMAFPGGAERWSPEDSLSIALFMGWTLTGDWELEIIRLGLAEERGLEKAWELAPLYQPEGPYIIPPEAWPGSSTARTETRPQIRTARSGMDPSGIAAILRADRSLRSMVNADGGSRAASNSWVVDGYMSQSGKPVLLNDPHLELTLPSVWYEIHLTAPGLDVTGATFPGVPLVVLGHSRDIAWAATTTTADMDDLFIEEVNPADPGMYKHGGQWVPFEVVEERIRVKGEQDRVVRVRISRHGPVINDALDPPLNTSWVLSLSWTGYEITDQTGAFMDAAKARDWDQFRRAMQKLGCPVQNWLYADAKGNIGYIAAGLFPVRPRHNGAFPAPGTGEYDWQGYVPLDDLPQVLNPSTHYLVTANNMVMPPERVPYVISYGYDPHYRARRIVDLLEEKKGGKWSAAELAAIQMDTVSLRARRLLPVFLKVLDKRRAEDEGLERAWRQLHDWDGDMAVDQSAPTIFYEAYWQVFRLTYEDEMSPELFERFRGAALIAHQFDRILESGDSGLFDDRRTPKVEDRDEIIFLAFKEAVRVLSDRIDPRMTRWEWGRMHKLRLLHPLGRAPGLEGAANFFRVNRSPQSIAGGKETVNKASWPLGDDFSVKFGPSLRHVVDFGSIEDALMCYPGGQSGQPFSPHYADQVDYWLSGAGHPMPVSREGIERHKAARLDLVPAVGPGG